VSPGPAFSLPGRCGTAAARNPRMPTSRQVRAVATLIACAAVLGAADDMISTYTFEEVADGRDIHEGIYGGHGDGEFDEWRLHLGVAPGLDRIQLKSTINGSAYPGPPSVETDKVINNPALSPQIGLEWVLGDYDRGDQGWFYSMGVEYTRREYKVLYALGTASVPLKLNAVAVQFGMGYAYYLTSSLRYEFEPFATVGLMWNELDLIDLSIPAPTTRMSAGPLVEAGLRNALIWHPGGTQSWHLGAALDYRTGYAQTIYNESGAAGDVRSEVRLWWYGFGGSLFYGQKF
jgi:hypothetical protein